MTLESIRKAHTENFLKFVDSYILSDETSYFVAVDVNAFVDNGLLLQGEVPMVKDQFNSCSLRFTTGDDKPWLVVGAEIDGVSTSITIDPALMQVWYDIIVANPEWHKYLPISKAPALAKDQKEIADELCPLGIKRRYAGTTGVCRACTKAKYKVNSEQYNFRCSYDGWYDPFKENDND